jgi:pyruvate formate lyase activating enzyme
LVKGIVFDLKKFAVHDGPGIRTTVFFKGCPLNCTWCHNPESKKREVEILVTTNRRRCLDLSYSETKEVIGREVSVDELMPEIKKDIPYYDESGGGVTFSGGEPMMQVDFLCELLQACKEEELHTTVDTSGYCSYDLFEKINDLVDLYLYDIKIIDEEKHRMYTGVSNKTILDNIKKLNRDKKKIHVRIPVVPEITDSEKNIKDIIEFLQTMDKIENVDILPFHKMGSNKFKKLDIPDFHKHTGPPPEEKINELKNRFESLGFSVKIGG